jgi:hypothetical protein
MAIGVSKAANGTPPPPLKAQSRSSVQTLAEFSKDRSMEVIPCNLVGSKYKP